MKQVLRTLLIEDSEDDAFLVLLNLRKGPFLIQSKRIDSALALQDALEHEAWEIILCDYAMPGFSGFQALSIVQQKGLDIPFIFVSGSMGEDTAVEAMQRGAHDYVMKGNLKRLLPAIERELKEAEIRRDKKRVEDEIIQAKNDWERTFDAIPDLILL
jgi:phosphoserine phosphatase RsbU/P